ncbi:Protein of unknown function [Lactobacillus helveticus CIRM-BIA 951]|uniref:Uncharacterized protein n=1 Tax=Lactobacillus helveticus CIRM-BIA 951 TaxID=1226334 RepID=U6F2T4_LACHE|nr:Protein of unknown function [Lactobacillus helveticus CIRM-BIA 951]
MLLLLHLVQLVSLDSFQFIQRPFQCGSFLC